MLNLLMKLLSKFIRPVIIQSHREYPHEIAFTDPENQLDTSKLFIGLVTKSLICKLEEGDITDSDEIKLYSSVIAFYASAVSYILNWFPLQESLVKDSQFVDFRGV